MERKSPTSFRLTPEALQLLKRLAAALGISQAAMLEVLIRERAQREGLRRVGE